MGQRDTRRKRLSRSLRTILISCSQSLPVGGSSTSRVSWGLIHAGSGDELGALGAQGDVMPDNPAWSDESAPLRGSARLKYLLRSPAALRLRCRAALIGLQPAVRHRPLQP